MPEQPANIPPVVTVDEAALDASHFTASGKKQFRQTVADYVQQLLQKSIHFGDIDRAQGSDAEITHEHVRSSAHSIARSFGKPAYPQLLVAAQVGEYVATAAAGVGGGHLDKPWGIVTFALGVSVAVILVVIRLTKGKGD